MNYKKIYILIFVFLYNCTTETTINNEINKINKINNLKSFSNKGFTLVYKESLFNDNIISEKINQRELTIFQKNLKKGTNVKIINILNKKYVIAKIGIDSKYPNFNNSVISERIAKTIDLNPDQPYVQIIEILHTSSFIAKKAKTFDEEKKVADKAPINKISVDNLNLTTKKITKKEKKKFNYIIKIADFYFINTAKTLKKRIKKETSIKKISIKKLSNTLYRVYLGPFYNINSLQNDFNGIQILEFENIEIIKHEQIK